MKFATALIGFMAATAIASPLPQETEPTGEVNAYIPDATEVVWLGEQMSDKTVVLGPEPTKSTHVIGNTRSEDGLEKRAGPVAVVIGITAVKAAAIVIKIAIEIGQETLQNLKDWNSSREGFTKKTINQMWARNPDYRKYPAAICYNKGYHFQNGKWTGYVKAKFSAYTLSTNYDCMYMEHGNSFYTHAEGGWINLAYKYDGSCKHDGRTGDLTCK